MINEVADPEVKQNNAKIVIDDILKSGIALSEIENNNNNDERWHEGYSVHTDGWTNYTDHSDYSEKK